jgi:outer membrane protein assembly factor BamA
MDRRDVITPADIQEVPYQSKFKLDYAAGGTGVGVGTNNVFGTTAGLAGGVQLLFSDILGKNQFFTTLQLNGEITDFGGSVAYLNRSNRINWGASLSRIPFRSVGFIEPFIDTLDFGDGQRLEAINSPYLIQRLFQNQAGLFAQLPFNTKQRAEFSASYAAYTNRVDQYNRYFDPLTGFQLQVFARPERRRELEQPTFFLGTVGGALVSDNSNFGLTAPLKGHRARLGFDQYFGEFGFGVLTADYRRYLYLGKATLAGRALHFGRYGGDEDFPLYLGSPWFMRGLSSNILEETFAQNDRSIEELIGTKLAIANLELRVPFTGPEQLTLIKSSFLFSDLNFFIDAGMAWTSYDQFGSPVFRLDENGEPIIFPGTGEPIVDRTEVRPIATIGASLRVNLFGQIILEPFVARPLVKGGSFNFGLNLLPGW